MVEERPHPRDGFQVLVGDDPEFAGELFDRVGERAGEGWVGVAEIGREQRDADAVAGGGKLVDEARRAVDEGAFGGVAGEPCGGGAGRFRLPADRRAAPAAYGSNGALTSAVWSRLLYAQTSIFCFGSPVWKP